MSEIRTVEELEALPDGSVLREATGNVILKRHGYWYPAGDGHFHSSEWVALPAVVLTEQRFTEDDLEVIRIALNLCIDKEQSITARLRIGRTLRRLGEN